MRRRRHPTCKKTLEVLFVFWNAGLLDSGRITQRGPILTYVHTRTNSIINPYKGISHIQYLVYIPCRREMSSGFVPPTGLPFSFNNAFSAGTVSLP